MKSLPLIPDSDLEPHLQAILERVPDLELAFTQEEIASSLWGGAFLRFLLLEHTPELLLAGGAALESIIYTRFYWCVVFTRIWLELNGPDAGMEQAEFKETVRFEYEPIDTDWALVEEVLGRAEIAAAIALGKDQTP